jgi:leucyl aminopeptidase
MNDFNDWNAILENSCKNWNNTAKNQLKRKISTNEDVMEDYYKHTRRFEVGFQNGSKVYVLYIPKNISVYDLHSELRASFAEGIEEHQRLSFNMLGVSLDHQRILVPALSGLTSLCQWRHPYIGKKNNVRKIKHKDFGFYSNLESAEITNLINYGEAVAEGTNLVRTLATTPTNYMTTEHLYQEAIKIAKRIKVSHHFLNENKLKEMNAGCFCAVVQGSKGKSRTGILKLSYKTRVQNAPSVAIVGKGVVFDTGGYNIKTDDDMRGMNRDMTGASVGLAVFQALAKNKVRANINLYLAIGDNLISEESYKPNDVVTAMNGTTVEVMDTDAEGRMMLADTILYAKESDPNIILDFATLTGDAPYAISSRYSCVFPSSYELGLKAVKVGMMCGERVWNFPMSSDFDVLLKSDVADISQCGDDDKAGHIYAACFLKHFVGKVPWVHVDLSSEHNGNGLGLVGTDVTGFGVRWGFEFIKHFIEEFNNGK